MKSFNFSSSVSPRNKFSSGFKFLGILLLVLLVSGKSFAAAFTSGNLAVLQAASNTANNTTGSIVEISPSTSGQAEIGRAHV